MPKDINEDIAKAKKQVFTPKELEEAELKKKPAEIPTEKSEQGTPWKKSEQHKGQNPNKPMIGHAFKKELADVVESVKPAFEKPALPPKSTGVDAAAAAQKPNLTPPSKGGRQV